ncbi:MAG: ubiquinol-cytochrome c reductase iron-sulfur subunit [Chloroflexi bacterium]|nr:MAG: ubiquinol-cytochrome c reductase iron-sulfur subunit [Chloroflexota bacterium]
MSEEFKLSRRKFLEKVTVGIGGVLTALFGIPAAIFVVKPVLKKDESSGWMRLGSISKVTPGTPTLFSLKVERETGWITDQDEIMVYVYTEDGRDYAVMSNICTHLACRVRWIEERQEFFCPCHNGVYDKQGTVLAGPPPRPLDRYEFNIENDDIYIKVG